VYTMSFLERAYLFLFEWCLCDSKENKE